MLVQGNSIFHEAPGPINDLGPCLHPERLFATGHTVLHHLNISGRLPNEFPVHQHPFLGMDHTIVHNTVHSQLIALRRIGMENDTTVTYARSLASAPKSSTSRDSPGAC